MATKGDISGLDVLTFGSENLVPQVAIGGFSRYKQSGVVRSDTQGGASRQRRRYFGTTHIAEVTFYLETAMEQDFFEMFVERNQGKRFICHLSADRPIVEPYVVQVISELNFSDVTAKDSTVSMTMEIYSVRDTELDQCLYDIYAVIGNDTFTWLNLFSEIVEVMPVE